MLRAEHLSSGYDMSQVLFDVSFEIAAGEVVTVLGRNGMGKTTLVRTLFGELPLKQHNADMPEGALYFTGQNVTGWTPDRIARSGIGRPRPRTLWARRKAASESL